MTGGPAIQARLKRRDAPHRDDAGAELCRKLAEVGLNGLGSLGLFILTFIIFHQWLKDDAKRIMQHLVECFVCRLCRSKMLSMNTGDKIKWNGSGRPEDELSQAADIQQATHPAGGSTRCAQRCCFGLEFEFKL